MSDIEVVSTAKIEVVSTAKMLITVITILTPALLFRYNIPSLNQILTAHSISKFHAVIKMLIKRQSN